SEGVLDDCNKMLLAGLGAASYPNSEEALRAYAGRYLDATAEGAANWARWLAPWGHRAQVPLPEAAEALNRLAAAARPGWRLEHWRSKVEMETLDRAIGTPKPEEWTPGKLALADRYFAAQERLYREVYRLGPVRHVINPRFMPPPWQASWSQATRTSAGTTSLIPQQ
ncbi:MAG: hypothetical protein KJ579_12290, partial [Verrucomicrobia bacterium]|nr:hypothetical protein [Verrucomicrobiota bacterium]